MDHQYKLLVGVALLVGAWSVMVSAAGHDRGYGLHLGSSNDQGGDQAAVCNTQCKINGMTFEGNSDFSLRNGCIEYSKCRCFCDGNWRCYDGVDLCNPENNAPNTGECQECEVQGIYYPSNSPFDYRRGCEEMTGCYCRCNGSWTCQIVRNTCPDRQTGSRGTNYRTGSRTEYSGSSTSRSNTGESSSSSGRNTGTSSSSSYSYESSSSSGRRTLSSSSSSGGSGGVGVHTGSRDGSCNTSCVVNGQQIAANSYFKYTNSCIEYQSCYCSCTGSWQCSAETGINICSDTDARADRGLGVLTGRQNQYGCLSCDVHGTFYSPDTSFTYRNGCVEWQDCRCECDGGWQCQPNRARWICDNVCRQCDVDGQMYDGNTEFVYRKEQECVEYDPCTCKCDGSWNCPSENGRWICTDRCLQCDVDGRIYEGGTDFKHREDCWEWDPCTCSCNGSYRCPKENAKWVCTDRCLTCDAKGRTYQGNTEFQMQDGCYQFNCDCNCDGSWTCPSNRTIDTCNQNVTTGCFYCNVHNQRYEGNSFFSHTDGCIRYEDCRCRCDGSWDCPGENAVDTCRQNATSGCYSCDVYGTRVEGYSRFQLEEDCWRYNCECDCAGGWQCSNSQVTYMCGTQQQTSTGCRDCLVSGNRYASRSVFHLQWGCIDYSCRCSCDGHWECPAASATVSCADNNLQQFQIQTVSNIPASWCKKCVINGYTYPGNSQFVYRERCVNHHVRCYCNGGYRTSTSVDNECITASRDSSITTRTSNRCRQCIMNGETFSPRAQFSIDVGCTTYRCRCTCSGLPECTPSGNLACGTAIIARGSLGTRSGTTVIRTSDSRTSSSGGSSSSSSSTRTGVQGTIVDSRPGTSVIRTGGTRTTSRGGSSSSSTSTRTGVQGTIVDSRPGTTMIRTGGTRTTSRGGGSSSSTSTRTGVQGTIVDSSRTVNRGGSVRVTSGRTTNTRGGSVVTTGSTSNRGGIVRVTSGTTGGSVGTRDRTTTTGGSSYGVFVTPGRTTNGGTVSSRTTTTTTVVRGGTGGTTVVTGNTGQCSICIVNNVQYATNSQFDYTRGCIRYQCTCACSGEATCKPAGFIDCQNQNTGVGCRRCTVEGRRYQALSQFTFRKECKSLSCLCECSGRAVCIQTQISNCNRDTDTDTEYGCRECRVDGQIYPPNSIFNTQRDCLRYTCQCGCNGLHRCTAPVNTCDTSPIQECRECVVAGRTYTTNQPLVLQRGCWRQQCTCSCNGQPDCDSQTAEYTCDDTDNTGCRSCRVNNIDYPPNSKFTNTEGCTAYKCHCFCDGNHYCVGTGTNVCTDNNGGFETVVNVGQGSTSVVGSTSVHIGTRPSGAINTGGGSTSTRTVITSVETSNTRDRRPTRIETSRTTTERRDEIYRREELARQEEAARLEREESRRRALEEAERRNREEIERQEREEALRRERDRTARQQIEEDARREREEIDRRNREEAERVRIQVEAERRRAQDEAERRRAEEEVEQRRVQEEEERVRALEKAERRRAEEEAERRRVQEEEERVRGMEEAERRRAEEEAERRRVQKEEEQVQALEEAERRRAEEEAERRRVQKEEEQVRALEEAERRRAEEEAERRRTEEEADRRNRDEITRRENEETALREREKAVHREKEEEVRREREEAVRRAREEAENRQRLEREEAERARARERERERNRVIATTDQTNCQTCTVDGSSYHVDVVFYVDRRCKRYKCICYCNGRYACETGNPINICDRDGNIIATAKTSTSIDTTQTDSITRQTDRTRNTSNRTRMTDNSTGRRTGTDSSTTRQTSRNRNQSTQTDTHTETTYYETYASIDGSTITVQNGEDSREGRCAPCIINGQTYPGRRDFQLDDGCKRFQCTCKCGGSWVCPRQKPARLCGAITPSLKGSSQTTSHTTNTQVETSYYETFASIEGSTTTVQNGEDSRDGRCAPCIINGQTYPGRRDFQLDDGCKRFQCTCKCGGSWVCPRQKPARLCGSTTRTSTGSSQTTSRTTFYEYEVRQGRSEVMLSREEIEAGGCGICVINNQPYKGGREFYHIVSCKKFRCFCSCDGAWNCPRQIPTWGCQERITGDSQTVDTRSTGSRTSDTGTAGSRSQGTQTSSSQTVETRTTGSRTVSTQSSGSRTGDHLTSSSSTGSFDRSVSRSGHSSGGARSSVSRSRSTSSSSLSSSSESSSSKMFYYEYEERHGTTETRRRTDTERQECGVCEVAGNTYQGGSNFRYDDSCKGFNCSCNCDGSWICPSQRPRILCPDQCKLCTVREQTHVFGSRFLIDFDECRKYQCTCHCNGRYTCLPGDVINVCEEGSAPDRNEEEEQTVACRSCIVDDQERQPNSRFQFRNGCIRSVCTCGCDGQHECSRENVCLGEERPGNDGCRECVVNGTRFPSDSHFQYIEDCYRFNCDCACDGSYDCPSRDTEYICDSGCQQCVLKNQFYNGNSQFQYEEGCFLYNCNCSCDGSYNCPPERTIDTCDKPVRENCKKCHKNGESYDPDTFFQYDDGCLRFSCDCFCNGSHSCPASRTENMCGGAVGSKPCTQCLVNGTVQQPNTDFYHENDCVRYRCHCSCNGAWDCQFDSAIPNCQKSVQTGRTDRRLGRPRCRACVVGGQRYRPNSRFQYTERCDRLECECGCNGSYNCPAELTRNICGGDRRCKDCTVRGTKYSGNSVFVLRERCLQYRCFCSCNGEWDCPADRAIDTCTGRG